MNCPVCGTSDKISAKDEPRFYRDGRLTAVCWHGHGNGRKVVFDAETGSLFQHEELQPYELLYRESETAAQARGLGGAFLARYAGIFAVTQGVVERSRPNVVTEQDVLDAAKDGAVLTVAPQYLGARLVGLEVRRVEVKAGQKVSRTFKMEGARGVYIADPTLQPDAVLIFEGTWDAATAAWDAFDHDEADRYAFCSIPADFSAKLLKETLSAHFPGIPALIISDQDGAGKGLRARMANAGVAHPAILKGVGRAKDYRDADPGRRWDALLEAIEATFQAPAPAGTEFGSAKVARRLFDGCLRAKAQGLRDLEAWRFAQRCAGICKAPTGGKRYFGIRAVIYGRTPTAEGLHDFDQILQHPHLRDVQAQHPNLAAIVLGGPTESPMSSDWRPPVFVEDGRHWTEIPAEDRKAYATARGWEPWTGREIGEHREDDLAECQDRIQRAFAFSVIPNAPHSEVGSRVLILSLALALSAMRAEERWLAGEATGFLPWVWFYGQPGTGKGTAGRIVACLISGDTRTYGSQRFGGEKESSWLTESVIHLPVAFKDELDTYLDRQSLEDLKTFIAGEAIQKRKAYGTDMTIAPRPVAFMTNEIKVNADDTPTKERIILCQLDKNPLASDQARNNAFEVFHDWLEQGGKLTLYRAAIQLYKRFRRVPIGKSTYTRSAMFDAAVDLVSAALGYKGVEIMRPSKENKEEAILHGSPWYRAIQDFIAHELDEADGSHAKAHEVWSISLDESGKRKMRRYITQFKDAAKAAGGHLVIGGFQVSIQPFQSSLASQSLIFRKGSLHVSA